MKHLEYAALAILTASLTTACGTGSGANPDTPGELVDTGSGGGDEVDTGSAEEDMGAPETQPETQPESQPSCDREAGVIALTTSDGVELAADYRPASGANAGAVVLLHMIPPNFDRSSYPPRVLDAIEELGLTVVNVDRRGAGDSKGDATEAYTGETASLDAEAAVKWLTELEGGCAVDSAKIAIVGASNGTTTALDYTVSRQDGALPAPKALIWLSPGTYTEAQNSIADNLSTLDEVPLLIVHPDNEPWATELDQHPKTCKIVEIEDGRHGTSNFDEGARERVQLSEMTSWLEAHVK